MGITYGIELEFFSIYNNHFSTRIIKPHRALQEKGEKFTKDDSIGTEYNSPLFESVDEAYFRLKYGLRKFFTHYYRRSKLQGIGMIGSWSKGCAGTHIHLGHRHKNVTIKQAKQWAHAIHSHIPLLIALQANSPIMENELARVSSARHFHSGDTYVIPIHANQLTSSRFEEMTINNKNGKTKTLEIRVGDSNLPEYVAAGMFIIQNAIKKKTNILDHEHYMLARKNAIKHGAQATLYWNNKPISTASYIRRFLRMYGVPQNPKIQDAFLLATKGIDGAQIIRRSLRNCKIKHPRKWERYFVTRYIRAVRTVINGHGIREYAKELHVRL